MRIHLITINTLICFALFTPTASAANSPTTAAHDVIQRFIGDRASDFTFELLPPTPDNTDNTDTYEIEAANNHVTIRGTTAVAMSHGAYDYLRESCHCFFGWEGQHVELPESFPDFPKRRITSPYQLRQDYNVCTFGYTTAFWDWPQWQHELDWMALHGINMPLASVATEAIWRRVWMQMGLTSDELDKYFTGPAFYPWHRMGNINGHDGPAPASIYDKQIALQKQIITRMRELGMNPVAPAFAGFVPPQLTRVHPEITIKRMSDWGDFGPQYNTYLLDPTSPLYPQIGKRFITEWEKEFGPAKYFLADSFNELQVPVPADQQGRLDTLAKYGDAVYRSIIAGEPNATWVMQGWLFYADSKFWDKPSTAALLSKVPNDRMIILDLACDFRPIWKSQDAFDGKQWIYSVIHNMGGKSAVGGPLDFFATDAAKTLAAPNHGNLIGFGLAPEGIENNEVIYELLCDAMWQKDGIDLATWLPMYCTARYGDCPPQMREAWELFRKSNYASEVYSRRAAYQRRPTTQPMNLNGTPIASADFVKGLHDFLDCSDQLGHNDLYRADAIEFTAQYLGSRIDSLLNAALEANQSHDTATRDRDAAAALDLMGDLDALMSAHPIYRLDRWVNFARSWGDTPQEKDYYESDAKRQITTWGGPSLSEYACRVWSGLIRSYYRGRWQAQFKSLQTGQPIDMLKWEESWITTPGVEPPVRKIDDPIAECKRLLTKGEQIQQPKSIDH